MSIVQVLAAFFKTLFKKLTGSWMNKTSSIRLHIREKKKKKDIHENKENIFKLTPSLWK